MMCELHLEPVKKRTLHREYEVEEQKVEEQRVEAPFKNFSEQCGCVCAEKCQADPDPGPVCAAGARHFRSSRLHRHAENAKRNRSGPRTDWEAQQRKYISIQPGQFPQNRSQSNRTHRPRG